jgi:RNA polymerase subunit RPABC4/transcription elongation factor Spt4
LTLVLLATLAVAVVAFVLYPVFALAPGGRDSDSAPLDEIGRERQRLSELKARLFTSLQDLDFEKAAGKLSEEDYEHARNDYLLQVSKVMARLDELAPKKKPRTKEGVKKRRKQEAQGASATEDGPDEVSSSCPSCQEPLPQDARFCPVCGEETTAASETEDAPDEISSSCPSCQESLPENARFCPECGEKVSA